LNKKQDREEIIFVVLALLTTLWMVFC
jgi:hypothetical protein